MKRFTAVFISAIVFAGTTVVTQSLSAPSAEAQASSASANGPSEAPSISDDGRYVAFMSTATNLVAGAPDPGSTRDIFIRDLVSGATTQIRPQGSNEYPNGESSDANISPDGRFVTFSSIATNLVPGGQVDNNGVRDVFVFEQATGIIERVSVDSNEVEGNALSYAGSVSSDGRYIVFVSYATNLSAPDLNGKPDVFVRDRWAGVTTRASVSTTGVEGNGEVWGAVASSNASVIGFSSRATNFAPGTSELPGEPVERYDVFVRDVPSGTTSWVSSTVPSPWVGGYDNEAFIGSISGDGRYVSFSAVADRPPPDQWEAAGEVFVHDRVTNQTRGVSFDYLGGFADDSSGGIGEHSVSNDGQFVAFRSHATDIVPADGNATSDIFLRDMAMAQTKRVSIGSAASEANGPSFYPAIAQGTPNLVVFESLATNLVTGDENGAHDVFVHNTATGETSLVSVVADYEAPAPDPVGTVLPSAVPVPDPTLTPPVDEPPLPNACHDQGVCPDTPEIPEEVSSQIPEPPATPKVIPETPHGEVLVVSANVYAPENLNPQFAARVRALSLKDSGGSRPDGMGGVAPDVFLLQEVNGLADAKGIAEELDARLPGHNYKVAKAAMDKEKDGVTSDTAIVYNAAELDFVRADSATTNHQDKVLPEGATYASLETGEQLLCVKPGQKRHYMASFREKTVKKSKPTPVSKPRVKLFAVMSVHMVSEGCLKPSVDEGEVYQRWSEHVKKEFGRFAREHDQAVELMVAGGDFNFHRCTIQEQSTEDPSCTQRSWYAEWNPTPHSGGPYDDSILARHGSSRSEMETQYYDGGEAPPAHSKRNVRIDYIFSRNHDNIVAASHDLSCGMSDASHNKTCRNEENDEFYSDHRLVWARLRG